MKSIIKQHFWVLICVVDYLVMGNFLLDGRGYYFRHRY